MTWPQDNAIHWINHYPVKKAGLPNTYLVDSYLSGRKCCPAFEQTGPDLAKQYYFLHASVPYCSQYALSSCLK